jgi:arylsulfatase B
VKFIRQSASGGPFFAYVAFNAPHDPLQAPEQYFKQYENLDDDPADGKLSWQQRQAAVTTALDDGIGRILKAIDEAGIAGNTLIWFVSDNGGTGRIPHNNDPLRGFKLSCYEGGVRVPGAAWWPGVIEGGRKIETPIVNVDLLPTNLRFCGGDASKAPAGPLDGVDVSAVLRGESPSDAVTSRDLYFFTGQQGLDHEQIAIISDGWKLMVTGPDVRRAEGFKSPQHKIELFHLSEDPSEKTDLSAKESARVDALGAKLVAFRKSEPERSLPPINKKPPRFEPPPHWHNAPATAPAGGEAR